MIKVEPCKGCGRMILVERMAGLTVKCEPAPLYDVGDIVRLLTSLNPPALWMVEFNKQGQPARLRGARPGEPGPISGHRCIRTSAAAPLLGGPKLPTAPTRPATAPQASPMLSLEESILGGPARPGDASTAPF